MPGRDTGVGVSVAREKRRGRTLSVLVMLSLVGVIASLLLKATAVLVVETFVEEAELAVVVAASVHS